MVLDKSKPWNHLIISTCSETHVPLHQLFRPQSVRHLIFSIKGREGLGLTWEKEKYFAQHFRCCISVKLSSSSCKMDLDCIYYSASCCCCLPFHRAQNKQHNLGSDENITVHGSLQYPGRHSRRVKNNRFSCLCRTVTEIESCCDNTNNPIVKLNVDIPSQPPKL